MADQGLGNCPVGTSAFGYGKPLRMNSTAALLFLDKSKGQRNAAEINSVSGDIVRDPVTGIHRGMDSVSQQVYLALRTLLGSSVVRDLGISFKITTISETTAQKVRDAVTAALEALVSRRLVEVVSVKSSRIKITGIEVLVVWKNLTNGETETARWTNG